ncbi:hypothetical protein C2869_00245 [Saccharobesus litoralis]|uniref:Uncharacterized protein n=1 Tax=Saccharobesus litoralis TaxID=2172099 RepID=A0A2S0VL79_9ALTE|nr:VC2046/SO_2500 family protein [Saccharobesus litoralis]AWB64963.1 hypothetical protein C2869_00245 [Saccharobesus litoralis]
MQQQPLVHELQLGNKLNHAIGQPSRADFGLLVAMLSEQAQEFAQFQLEKQQIPQDNHQEEKLKAELGIVEPLRLSADENYFKHAHNINKGLHQAGMASMCLNRYLIRDALSQYNDPNKLDDNVLANCSLHAARRIKAQEEGKDPALEIEQDLTQLKEVIEQANQYAA